MAASSRTALSSSLFLVLFLFSFAEAREILVGGKPGAWKIPASPSDSLNQWAERARFRIGDTLVWKYDGEKDSVLQVTEKAYTSCNTADPIAEHKDGETKVKLDKAGPFYFISGEKDHCKEGQKLLVVVMTPKQGSAANSPAPSPAESEVPAVAPVSGAVGVKGGFWVAVVIGVLGLALV